MDFWQYEKEAMAEGHAAVCGCDEAGAGPLAGPVYAAAVVLPLGADIPGLAQGQARPYMILQGNHRQRLVKPPVRVRSVQGVGVQ